MRSRDSLKVPLRVALVIQGPNVSAVVDVSTDVQDLLVLAQRDASARAIWEIDVPDQSSCERGLIGVDFVNNESIRWIFVRAHVDIVGSVRHDCSRRGQLGVHAVFGPSGKLNAGGNLPSLRHSGKLHVLWEQNDDNRIW